MCVQEGPWKQQRNQKFSAIELYLNILHQLQFFLIFLTPSRMGTFACVEAWWDSYLSWYFCDTVVCRAPNLGRKWAVQRCLISLTVYRGKPSMSYPYSAGVFRYFDSYRTIYNQYLYSVFITEEDSLRQVCFREVVPISPGELETFTCHQAYIFFADILLIVSRPLVQKTMFWCPLDQNLISYAHRTRMKTIVRIKFGLGRFFHTPVLTSL